MKTLSRFSAAALLFALFVSLLSAPLVARVQTSSQSSGAQTAQQETPPPLATLQRGYRTGYSDGYQSGWGDASDKAPRDFRSKEDYRRADRAYAPAHGALEDYRDGYRQGFEAGYATGFEKSSFDSTVPDNLARRGVAEVAESGDGNNTAATSDTMRTETASKSPTETRADETERRDGANASREYLNIPSDTVLRVELINRLTTDVSQRGDRFEARVLEPAEHLGAVVGGRVISIERPGRVRGRAGLQLSFDQIRGADGVWENFNAVLIEVLDARDETNVGEVDVEGGVRGKDSTKDDAARVGATAGVGAIIGAIAGGGKGAAIGAAIGGAAGAGTVVAERGKEIRLEPGQHLLIRTSTETRLN